MLTICDRGIRCGPYLAESAPGDEVFDLLVHDRYNKIRANEGATGLFSQELGQH